MSGADLSKEDLLGGSSGGSTVPTDGGEITPEQAQQAVDKHLGAETGVPTAQGQRSPSSSNVLREVRNTVNEFNQLVDELKSNPHLAKALTGGEQAQSQPQQEQAQRKEKTGDNMEDLPSGLDEDQAFQLFKMGINQMRDALGDDTTLKTAEQTLEVHEDRVKSQLSQALQQSQSSPGQQRSGTTPQQEQESEPSNEEKLSDVEQAVNERT